ncbi:MAG: DUF4493 domain-containing protein [Candidatus Cryptobacteroides sp.]
MKKTISYMMAGISALTLLSCNREVIVPGSYGYLSLNAESDLSTDVIVKSSSEDIVFSVDINNGAGQTVAHSDDHRTITADNPVKLQIGTYEVIAYNGENLNAAFDRPYYEGKEKVKILPDKTQNVELVCSLANSIFSVEFTDDFAANFPEYHVSVTNGIGDNLVLSNNPQEGNELEAGFSSKAYFAVTGTLSWELSLKNKEGGIYKTSMSYNDVVAKSHYHLKFELGPEEDADGAVFVKVIVDSSLEEVPHEVVLDFNNTALPEVKVTSGFNTASGESISIPIGNTTPKTISVSAPEGLRNFRISHTNPLFAEMGLPQSVELVGDDAATESLMDGLGIKATQTIQTKSIIEGSTGMSLDFTDFVESLPVGLYAMKLIAVDMKGHFDDFDLAFEVISDVDAEAVSVSAGWASFAQFKGRYFQTPAPAGISFQYKESSASSWTDVNTGDIKVDASSMTFTYIVTGLKASTKYVFRAVSAEDKETKEIEFTTSSAETIHNLSFDNWSSSDKMPDAEGYTTWDSANSTGMTITTTPSTDAVSGKAARLESVSALGLLAAGNIFTGQFVGVDGLGAKLDWGVTFTSRPIALRGYYKYSPKTIDKAKAPYTDKKGQMDESQILIFLSDWTGPFRVNTNNKEFVDYDNDPGIIALGQLNTSDTDSDYVKFTLPLVYRDNSRIPTYIVIAAASSRYGDYFTGGVGSVLLIDEFEFVYDPAELTDEEFNTVFSKVDAF